VAQVALGRERLVQLQSLFLRHLLLENKRVAVEAEAMCLPLLRHRERQALELPHKVAVMEVLVVAVAVPQLLVGLAETAGTDAS
jgi:hypothetical protein